MAIRVCAERKIDSPVKLADEFTWIAKEEKLCQWSPERGVTGRVRER